MVISSYCIATVTLSVKLALLQRHKDSLEGICHMQDYLQVPVPKYHRAMTKLWVSDQWRRCDITSDISHEFQGSGNYVVLVKGQVNMEIL